MSTVLADIFPVIVQDVADSHAAVHTLKVFALKANPIPGNLVSVRMLDFVNHFFFHSGPSFNTPGKSQSKNS